MDYSLGDTSNSNRIVLIVIVIMVLLFSSSAYFAIAKKSALVLFTSILLLVEVIYIISFTIKQRRFYKRFITASKKNPDETPDQELAEDIKELSASLKETNRFSEVLPSFKPYWISIIFMLYSFVFILFFLWGQNSAEKQSTFYFIDNETAIISLDGSNVISISVSYNEESNTYYNTGLYKIIPQEGLSFKLVNCGPIVSDIKQDTIKISISFN